ncbi:MAG: hypothetical protein KDA85_14835 [Planctomycetaceae bacterium]|nr:hypothetical protein [Planctomycetaceae bacterium]
MPILSKEPSLYPDDLLNENRTFNPDESWFAMYTLARHEKELVRKLRAQKIAHYCPLAESRKRSPSGRIRVSYLPLFTGYVFVCGTEVQRSDAVATGCISRCLNVTDGDDLRDDLRRILLLTEKGNEVRPEPKPLVGRRAVVKVGAMKGAVGTVTKEHGGHRLTVLVRFMQQGASVQIDEADLEFLD